MKNLTFIISAFILFAFMSSASAQQIKESLISKKCKSVAKEKEKELKKEGYHTIGGGSIFLMAYDQCLKDNEKDKQGNPVYIIGTAETTAKSVHWASEKAQQYATAQIVQNLGQTAAKLISEAASAISTDYSSNDDDNEQLDKISKNFTSLAKHDLNMVTFDKIFEVIKDDKENEIIHNTSVYAIKRKDGLRIAKRVYFRELSKTLGEDKAKMLIDNSMLP